MSARVQFVPEFLITSRGFNRLTFREIADTLNAQGKVTKHGQPFTAANVGMIWKRARLA